MITNVNVSPLEYSTNNTVALASVTVDNTLTVNSIAIKRNTQSDELYVQMPQKFNKNKEAYEDIAFPTTQQSRDELNAKVLEKYRNPDVNMDIRANEPVNAKIDANIAKYSQPLKNGKIGAGTISVGDSFVVRNVSVFQSDKGQPFWNMPSYKALDGSFKSIVVPTSKEAYRQLDSAVKAEINTRYAYRMVDPETFKNLKAACPDLYKQCSGFSEDKNIKIKFDEANKAAMNEILGKLSAKNTQNAASALPMQGAAQAARPAIKR